MLKGRGRKREGERKRASNSKEVEAISKTAISASVPGGTAPAAKDSDTLHALQNFCCYGQKTWTS